ncbi:MAG: hypothetical protein NTV23_16165 [Propionibacteriales bacterium]|nr:hypothetical protein [Propionibacteriales bacterium]
MIRFRAPRWRLGLVVILLGASVAVAPTSYAGHGSDSSAGDPDNRDHYIDRNSVTANGDAATQWGIWELNQTYMNATLDGSGDVEVYDDYYGETDWAGMTNCASGYNWLNGNCDVFRVRFNQTTMFGYGINYWRSLGCHEFGHTAGLGHRSHSTDADDNSCMRSDIWPLLFDVHDINSINDHV